MEFNVGDRIRVKPSGEPYDFLGNEPGTIVRALDDSGKVAIQLDTPTQAHPGEGAEVWGVYPDTLEPLGE